MRKNVLTMLAVLFLVSGPVLAAIVLEDGEGASAQLDAKYTHSGDNALRVAQMTTEQPGVPVPVGSGSAKFVFDVDGSPWRAGWKNQLGSSLNLGDYMDGALELEFYYRYSQAADPNDPAQWFTTADRQAGAAQWQLYIDLVDDVGKWIYFQITLVNDVSPGEAQLGHVNLDAWNTVHIEISGGAFGVVGSTIAGNQIDGSNFTTSTNITNWAERQHFWQNIVEFNIQDNHAGLPPGEHAEGWFGIDDMKVVPEPTAIALLALGALPWRRWK